MIDKLINLRDKYLYNKTINYISNQKEEKILKKTVEIKNQEKRYNYIYDELCKYLDNEFKKNNPCDFKCNMCKKSRYLKENNIKRNSYINGCCYLYTEKRSCEYLTKDGTCKTKCLGCKLFTCDYIQKDGYKYKLKDIYLSKYFLNHRQKTYIEYALKKPKEVVIKGILKRRSVIEKLLDKLS